MRCFFVAMVLAAAGCETPSSTLVDEGLGADTLTFWPPEAGRGTEFTARLEAGRSVFDFGEGEGVELGTGLTVNSFTVLDGWNAVANVTVAADAEIGPRDIRVTAADEVFILDDALTIVDDSFTLQPNRAQMGEMITVEFVGTNTEWDPGKTWASFGEGVEVQEVTVYSEAYMTALVSVEPDASPGKRDVTVETGPDLVTQYGGFTVDRVGLTAVFDPAEVSQGETVPFTVKGDRTHFAVGSVLSFYQGGDEKGDIVVNSVTALDSLNLYGTMTVSNGAELGTRDVLITTGDEGVYLEDALTVSGKELDLSQVGISTWFYVLRGIDNATGDVSERVAGGVVFYLPLDPPCPSIVEICGNVVDDDDDGQHDCYDSDCASDPACGGGPMPYDSNGWWRTYEQGGSADCPANPTVGAGEHVWFESECNVVTFDRATDSSSGMIYYTTDLVLDDYCFDQLYALHTEGEEGGIGEYVIDGVQPTVPADYRLLEPEWCCGFTHNRAEDLTYTWTPAQTYPDAIFMTSISGQLVEPEGANGYAGSLPWDDGEHSYTPDELGALKDGPATFTAYSYIEGPTYGFPFSTIQTNYSKSYLLYQGSVTLE